MNLEFEIASRLGVSPEEVRPVLETVIERIRQQVAHYGYARLAGLGTFRGQDGSVSFEPDPGLSESVNLRFAGLNELQVDLPGTPPIPPADEIEEEAWPIDKSSPEEEEEFAWQEEADLEEETPALPLQDDFPMPEEEVVDRRWREESECAEEEEEEAEELESVAPPEYDEEEEISGEYEELEGPPFVPLPDEPLPGTAAWEDEPTEEVQPSWGTGEEDEFEVPEEEEFEEEEELEVESGVTWQDEADELVEHPLGPRPPEEIEEADYSFIVDRERSAVDEPAPKAADRNALHHDRIRREPYGGKSREPAPARRTGVWIGAGVVFLIAAAAVGYFVLRPVEPQSTSLIDQAPIAMTDSAAMAPDTLATQPDVTAVQPDGADEVPVESEPPVQEPPTESTPLRSAESIDPSGGGFTIVVYSETSSGPAEQNAQRFRNQGYRTGVLQSRDGGVTRYRVGVGQFRSFEEATRARDSLSGEEIPEDAWVYRIR